MAVHSTQQSKNTTTNIATTYINELNIINLFIADVEK